MIALTRLDGSRFHLNATYIVTLEESPDTVLHLQTGTSIMVKEHVEEILQSIVVWHKLLARPME